MPIYELEPRIKIGFVEIGRKMGSKVPVGSEYSTREGRDNPPKEYLIGINYRVEDPDTVFMKWSFSPTSSVRILRESMINRNPALRRHWRWVPDR